MTNSIDHHPSFQRTGALIQIPSVLKGTLYLGSAIVILEGAFRLHKHIAPDMAESIHVIASPMIILLTTGFQWISRSTKQQATEISIGDRFGLVKTGAILGVGTYLVWLASLASRGWVSLPAWGWETAAPHTVISAVATTTLTHLAVALNEEQIFRGYGFDVWQQAIGTAGATTLLSALFMAAHRPTTLAGVGGYLTLGLVCMGLRHVSGSVWVPIGYHWGWNLIQTGILGHTDEPSIRPALVDGPETWVGTNAPETGWLTTILNLLVLVGMLLWQRRQQQNG